ncbi:cytochrome P450 [Salinibacterium sp. SYSU T00001]|uniref:cytochrome P450 n=1 Tax=Homoserinimonas sedimenticola TaxID=2986805 RepID=UPI0022362B27|nr:cytochrome P450 [Salinibacterium sedimenticola]MCW4385872.1 cytochrome P450 [Salinibacterium sedimenticola]
MTDSGIPRLPVLDSTLGFLGDGYLFGTRRFDRVGGDAFRTRMMGRPVTITRGADAAEMFYSGGRFGRDRAMPTSVFHLLQDEGSVQSLSGHAHAHRKGMFQRALGEEDAVQAVGDFFERELLEAAAGWHGRVVLYDELVPVLTRTALRWVGVMPATVDIEQRGAELISMIDNAGTFGPANWAARARRKGTEAWAAELIETWRARGEGAEQGSIIAAIAHHADPEGNPLPTDVAAVELINVLRPVVAVARFIVFVAHALRRHPTEAERLREDDDAVLPFVQEVRRFYPFFPVIGGTARIPFSWHGESFAQGDWVMLDLYGTNHHPALWAEPERFRPERFASWAGDPYTLVPQGAGDADTGHRCPGERATIELMVRAARCLSRDIRYSIPEQDLRISLQRFPAIPESGFVIEDVTLP